MLNSGSHCLAAEEELRRIHNSPEVIEYTQKKKVLNFTQILLKFYSNFTQILLKFTQILIYFQFKGNTSIRFE